MNQISSMSPADRLAEAEAEKVSLEIEQLRKPVYRRVPFWTGIVIPLVILTASLVTGEVTGFFDEQLRDLEQQKIDLQEQLQLAETTARAVSANNNRLEQEKAELIEARQQLEAEKDSLKQQLAELDSSIQIHQETVEKLKTETRQLSDNAKTATRELETVFGDLNQLLGEKGELFRLVVDTPMEDSAKQQLLDQLRQHLHSIQETGTHLDKVRGVLRQMKVTSG